MILKAPLSSNRTFQVDIKAAEIQCLAAVNSSDSWLWHARFGHLNFRSLNQLGVKQMVKGLPEVEVPEKVCGGCLISKQSRNSFKSHLPMRSTNVLEVVHSDVCGPFEIPTIGGNQYFVTFVDEYSRMM